MKKPAVQKQETDRPVVQFKAGVYYKKDQRFKYYGGQTGSDTIWFGSTHKQR